VTVSERPELAPLVAEWRVRAFFTKPGGYTVGEMTALILKPPGAPNRTLCCSMVTKLSERLA
jgi:hypothetical protein